MTRSAADAGTGKSATARHDLALALLLALAAFALYAGFGLRLAAGRFGEIDNLAFDFDPARYVAMLGGAEYERGGVKHPLALPLLRPLGWPLLAVGLDAKQVAALVMAGFGGATVGVVFLYLRAVAAARAPAVALAVLFAVSAGQAITAIVPEAYAPAAFGIALAWLLAVRAAADPRRLRGARVALAVFNYGITLTNVAQSLLAEAVLWLRARGLRGAVRPLLGFGLAVAALAALFTALAWADLLWAALTDPTEVVKQVFWARTKGERLGAVDTLWRLVGFTVVPPGFDRVDLPDDGIVMVDFRTPRFAPWEWLAWGGWQAFWLIGAVALALRPATRWLALGLALALAGNVVLHLDFQFRGSVFLYVGHTHFLVFALGTGLAPGLAPGRATAAYVTAVLALAALAGAATLERMAALASAFDTLPACAAACAE